MTARVVADDAAGRASAVDVLRSGRRRGHRRPTPSTGSPWPCSTPGGIERLFRDQAPTGRQGDHAPPRRRRPGRPRRGDDPGGAGPRRGGLARRPDGHRAPAPRCRVAAGPHRGDPHDRPARAGRTCSPRALARGRRSACPPPRPTSPGSPRRATRSRSSTGSATKSTSSSTAARRAAGRRRRSSTARGRCRIILRHGASRARRGILDAASTEAASADPHATPSVEAAGSWEDSRRASFGGGARRRARQEGVGEP